MEADKTMFLDAKNLTSELSTMLQDNKKNLKEGEFFKVRKFTGEIS